MTLKGSKMKLDIRQKIDHVCANSTWGAVGLILGACAVNVILCLILDAVGTFIVNLIRLSFNGYIVASLSAVLSLIRNLIASLVVFNLVLKKDVLKLDENTRYVIFLVLNFVVYALSGCLVHASLDSNGLLYLIYSPFNYLGIGAAVRFVMMLTNLGSLLRYYGVIMFIAYLMYQCIEIFCALLSTGWIVRLLSEEVEEKGLTMKEALIRPFTVHKEEMTKSNLTELAYEQSSEVLIDTGCLPVSEELVDLYCTVHHEYFSTDKMVLIRHQLMMLSESQFQEVTSTELINPNMMLIVSSVSGSFGMDRFLLKDNAMGLLKLLTFGCFGILTLLDLLTIRKKTQDLNFKNLMMR